jgi:hypothetical protein
MDGDMEFDSTFDVQYSAVMSVGHGPSVPVMGLGTARAAGVAPGGGSVFEPLVYEAELLSLDLGGNSYLTDFRLRESPTLESSGVTTVQDPCPVCGAPFTGLRISSFFDVFAEVSLDGGTNWLLGDGSIRIVQTPEPATFALLVCGAAVGLGMIGRRRPA